MLKQPFLLLFLTFWTAQNLAAQADKIAPPSLVSPHSTLYTHTRYLEEDCYKPEVAALAVGRESSAANARILAIQLKEILDGKGLLINLDVVPSKSDFTDTSKTNKYVPFPRKLPDVYLEKRNGEWVYSLHTLAIVSELHRKVYPIGSHFLIHWLSKLGKNEWLGLEQWKYIGALLYILFCGGFFYGLRYAINGFIDLLHNKPIEMVARHRVAIEGIAVELIWFFILSIALLYLPALQLPTPTAYLILQIINIGRAVFGILILTGLTDLIINHIQKVSLTTANNFDEHLVPIIGHIVKTGLIVIGIINILYLLDVNVQALIAGVSIGGLAFALAAQDTVKNLIGSIMIFADKPFRIGDHIQTNEVNGTVQEVGFRSTRIRTLDGTIFAIPNGRLADVTVNNLGIRETRRFKTTLLLSNGATTEQIEMYITKLRATYLESKMTQDDSIEVFLSEIKDNSFIITINVLLMVTVSSDESAAKQALLLDGIRIANEMGIDFTKK